VVAAALVSGSCGRRTFYRSVRLMVLFQRWHRPAAPTRRRRPAHRLGALEHLERRLALSAAPAWVQNLFPKAEAATAIFAQDVFGRRGTG
jgi:hypothetical protein